LAELGRALEKYFGPSGVFGPDAESPSASQIKVTPLSDAALKATIKEYTVPSTGAMAHSVTVDSNSGVVFFGEYDTNNKLARFDPETEKFEEFKVPVKSNPHTGTVLKDGSFVIALANSTHALAWLDPKGNITVYERPDRQTGAHSASVSPDGKSVWVTSGGETLLFDVNTKKFQIYKNPVPETFPAGSQAAFMAKPGEKPRGGGGYDVAGDSKGFGWVTQLELGNVLRIDPKTSEWKIFHTPQMRSARGIAVDAQDNIWWGDYYGNKLGMLNQKTGEIKLYPTPTPKGSPYGVTPDRKNGFIWFADTVANQITRFDPKTETFIEYPLPTRNTSVRFHGVDPRGRAWYGGFWSGKIGVIDPTGGSMSTASQQ
jgi:virginiamycin B lyase